jgi:two-component system, OmpR family, response regulator ResD
MIAQLLNPTTTTILPATPLGKLSPAPRQPVQVLVIDDEEPLRRLLRLKLQNAGYHVSDVADAKAALALLPERPFDVILVDLMMPGMDGHSLCREIRKVSDVPIIMISAMNRPQAVLEGFAAGADDYINKPFQLRDIDLRITALLRCVARCHEAQLAVD